MIASVEYQRKIEELEFDNEQLNNGLEYLETLISHMQIDSAHIVIKELLKKARGEK